MMNGKNSERPASDFSLWSEVARLLWLAACVQLTLALVSYSPSDPSWSTWTSKPHFHNWMGRAGSVTADLLLQLFGLTAFALALLMGAIGFRRLPLAREESSVKSAIFAPLFFLVSLSGLLQCTFPKRWMPFGLRNPGGLSGSSVKALLTWASGEMGAVILSTVFVLAMTIVLFRIRVVSRTLEWLSQGLPALWAKIKAYPATLLHELKAAFGRSPATQGAGTSLAVQPSMPMPAIPMPMPSLPKPVKAKPPAEIVIEDEPEVVEEDEDDDSPVPIKTLKEDDEELFKILGPEKRPLKKTEAAKPRKTGNQDYQLPSLGLLSGRAESKSKPIDKNWYIEKGNILVQKLKDFGVEGEVVHISPGPVITVYEFKPASGVKIKEIANLSDDLTLALSVLSVRIVAPIPGKPVVGIEIPSPHRETVFFKDLIEETPFYNSDIRIPIVLGRLASGEPIVAGLASMPHLLVAGSTGTGKSVFINTLICSLLYRYNPQQLKLILVDPKMVELATYEGVPHLMLPVVVDSKKAALALRWTVDEMERRYSLMHKMGVRHIDSYNEKVSTMKPKEGEEGSEEESKFLPYIVVVVDEYADLMAVVPKDVELSIARLAQKARASGIHLVLATQRPSTDVVTGTIKANFPSRISFRVASGVDSKTILDRTGAERLLGAGDMLFHSAGFTSLKRMQGAFMSDADLEKVTTFLKEQGEPQYDERIMRYQEEQMEAESGGGDEGEDEGGNLYDRAVRLCAEKGEASISLIQRHLKIGYNRAATLMEEMEKNGVVAQATGASKRRQVLVNNI